MNTPHLTHLLVIMSICAYISVEICLLAGEVHILRRRVVRSYGSCMLNPLRNLQTAFQSSYNIWHFHRLSMWVPMDTYTDGLLQARCGG